MGQRLAMERQDLEEQGKRTGFPSLCVDGVRVELLMVCDVPELLALPPQVQLITLGHPFRLGLPKDMNKAWLGKLGCQLGLEGEEGIDGI